MPGTLSLDNIIRRDMAAQILYSGIFQRVIDLDGTVWPQLYSPWIIPGSPQFAGTNRGMFLDKQAEIAQIQLGRLYA